MKELSHQEILAWNIQALLNLKESPDTRKDAIKWLSADSTSEAFNALWCCREDDNIKVRRAIIYGLGAFENSDVFLFLKQCLQNNDELVKRNALETLARWSNKTDLDSSELLFRIKSLLEDPNIEVRKASLFFAVEYQDNCLNTAVESHFFKLLNDEKANKDEYNLARVAYAKYVGEEKVSNIINKKIDDKRAEKKKKEIEKRLIEVENWKKRVAEYNRQIQNSLGKLKRPVPKSSYGYRLSPGNHYEEALLDLGSLYFEYYIKPWLMNDIVKINEDEWIENGSDKQLILGNLFLGNLVWKIGYDTTFDNWVQNSKYVNTVFTNSEGHEIIVPICYVMLSDSHWRTRWFAAAILRCLKDVSALPALSQATQDEEGDVRDEARDAISEIEGRIPIDIGRYDSEKNKGKIIEQIKKLMMDGSIIDFPNERKILIDMVLSAGDTGISTFSTCLKDSFAVRSSKFGMIWNGPAFEIAKKTKNQELFWLFVTVVKEGNYLAKGFPHPPAWLPTLHPDISGNGEYGWIGSSGSGYARQAVEFLKDNLHLIPQNEQFLFRKSLIEACYEARQKWIITKIKGGLINPNAVDEDITYWDDMKLFFETIND